MISNLPLEIIIQIIACIPDPRNLLMSNHQFRAMGKDNQVRGVWVLNQDRSWKKWLQIASKLNLLNQSLLLEMIKLLDNSSMQYTQQKKLINWFISNNSRSCSPKPTSSRLKLAILSKNHEMLREFGPFFATIAGEKMKMASLDLCIKVGFHQGVSFLKCL